MRELLYIRVPDADASDSVEYCVARADAMASFAVARAPLAQVLELAAQRRVVLLAPSTQLRLAAVAVPARQAGKALLAVPFALEEQLAEDVDTLHFALGARQADGRWPVAIVAEARLRAWLQPFQAAGIRPEAMLPDVLALAVPDDGHFSALLDGDQVIVRTARDSGFTCAVDDLALCLQLADPERTRTLRLSIPREAQIDASRIEAPLELLHGVGTPLEALLQQLQRADAINLLQGRHAPQRDRLRWFAPWKHAAALAAAALGMGALLYGVETFRLQRELAAQEAANIARYQQAFPDETRIVDLAVQLDQRLAALQRGGGGGQLLPLVNVLAAAVSAVPGLQLQSLQFREGSLYAGLTAADLERLERLKSWFAGAGGTASGTVFSVESANAGAEGVQIRIKLSAA